MEAQSRYMQQMESGQTKWFNTESPAILDGSSAGLVNRSRYALAQYINANPEDVVLVDNASGAINALLRSLPLKAGDIIIDFAVVYQVRDVLRSTSSNACLDYTLHYRSADNWLTANSRRVRALRLLLQIETRGSHIKVLA